MTCTPHMTLSHTIQPFEIPGGSELRVDNLKQVLSNAFRVLTDRPTWPPMFSTGGDLRLDYFKQVVAVPSLRLTGAIFDWSAFNTAHCWVAIFTFLYLDLLDATGTLYSMATVIDDNMPGEGIRFLLQLQIHCTVSTVCLHKRCQFRRHIQHQNIRNCGHCRPCARSHEGWSCEVTMTHLNLFLAGQGSSRSGRNSPDRCGASWQTAWASCLGL